LRRRRNNVVVGHFEAERARKQAVWQVLDATEPDVRRWTVSPVTLLETRAQEPAYFVSKHALTRWMTEGLAPPVASNVIDLDGDGDADKAKADKSTTKSEADGDDADSQAKPEADGQDGEHPVNGDNAVADAIAGPTGSSSHLPSVTPIVTGESGAVIEDKQKTIDSSEILCRHRKVAPHKAGSVKVISQVRSFSALRLSLVV
jgi:hypothetical protein